MTPFLPVDRPDDLDPVASSRVAREPPGVVGAALPDATAPVPPSAAAQAATFAAWPPGPTRDLRVASPPGRERLRRGGR